MFAIFSPDCSTKISLYGFFELNCSIGFFLYKISSFPFFILVPNPIFISDKDLIKSESKRVNLSSLLESNVGRLHYLHLCSAFNIKEESGIAPGVLFENDICVFPNIKQGEIFLHNKPGIGIDEINL